HGATDRGSRRAGDQLSAAAAGDVPYGLNGLSALLGAWGAMCSPILRDYEPLGPAASECAAFLCMAVPTVLRNTLRHTRGLSTPGHVGGTPVGSRPDVRVSVQALNRGRGRHGEHQTLDLPGVTGPIAASRTRRARGGARGRKCGG